MSYNSELTPDEKKNKKIAIRFLKECGLLKAWYDYIREQKKIKPINFNPYKQKYITEIFGRQNFTQYLREKRGYFFDGFIVSVFRCYLIKTGQLRENINFDRIGTYEIDGKTHKINLK